jgi:hypothetical protein
MFDRAGHLTECALVSYLVGDIDELGARRLEHHVGTCSTCAARLQREAAFETALYDAADGLEVVVTPARRRWERVTVAATAILSMAAALLLAVSDPRGWIDVHPGNADSPELVLRTAAIAGQDVTPASYFVGPTGPDGLGMCFPPVDDEDDCDDLVALATFPDDEGPEPAPFEAFAPRAPLCEDDEDSGPMCLDG